MYFHCYQNFQIDQRGPEEALERGYRAAVAAAAIPGVRYEPFDFHTECRGMRYDRLNVLIDRIHHEQVRRDRHMCLYDVIQQCMDPYNFVFYFKIRFSHFLFVESSIICKTRPRLD